MCIPSSLAASPACTVLLNSDAVHGGSGAGWMEWQSNHQNRHNQLNGLDLDQESDLTRTHTHTNKHTGKHKHTRI
jgi:hypothetical protein